MEGEDAVTAEAPAEIETPIAFAPQDLPVATADINLSSSILQDLRLTSVLHDIEPLSETLVNVRAGMVSSPTLSISTVSDLTPTELGEEIEQTTAHHDTFYFEDGNVDIVCGNTVFRVHSTIISFSSPKLRYILSPSALLCSNSRRTTSDHYLRERRKFWDSIGNDLHTGVGLFFLFCELCRLTT